MLRQVLEAYDAILNSVWFWIGYTIVGIRITLTEWDEISEADRADLGWTPAGALLVLFIAWPYLWFWREVRWLRAWLEAKGLR